MGRSRLKFGAVAAAIMMAVGALVVTPAAAATTVVRTFSVNSWFGFNEGPSGSVGNATLVSGPGTPHAGLGSAQLTVDGTGRASLATNGFAGTLLASISTLSYSTYPVSASLSRQANLQFDVDYDTTDSSTAYTGRLSFGRTTAAPINTWTSVNALTDGEWFASAAPGTASCPQSNPCTWSEVLTAFPTAGIRNDSVGKGALLFRLGGPVAGGATTYVDNLSITRPSGNSVVDFEPGAFITPTIGPPGQAVTVQGHGYKANAWVRVIYDRIQGGLHDGPKKKRICRVRANAAGVATCNTFIPAVAGPVGVHPVRVIGRGAGGSALSYNVEFVRSP